MAVSGIIMLLFLIAHMVGNLHVFQGAKSFNHYSEWLRTVGEPALPLPHAPDDHRDRAARRR